MDPTATPIPIDELLDHRAWVRALARSMVRDVATADDVEQDAWLAAMRRPPSDRERVRAWLAKVTRNLAREHGRTSGRRARREAVAARPEAVEPTADVVARAESHKRVVLAVMDLDEPYRTTLLLRFFEDLPPRDVAARMDCPVETVRTRVKRGLARLREDLDGDGESRGWRALVLPLLPSPTGGGVLTSRGDRKMPKIALATLAALLLAVPTTFVLLAQDDMPPDAPAPTETATSPEDDARDRADRDRVVPPPIAPPGDEDEEPPVAAERVTFGSPENPLPPPEDASVFADGRLTLRLSVEPPHPRADEPFQVVATFGNTGSGPLRFHVPEFAGSVPFPYLELRGADGGAWMPVPASFQSEWVRGVQGTIVRLEPGEEHVVKTHVSGVVEVPDDPAERERGIFAHSQKRFDLPPGDYALSAVLSKDRPVVPWGDEGFARSLKEVPGLWTGELRAAPISIRLAPPDEPMLTLRAPDRLAPGEDLTVTLEIANPSQEDRELRGAFAFHRTEKGGPLYVAWFVAEERAIPAPPDHARSLTLAAGETRTCRIDLGALLWTPTRRRGFPLRRKVWPHDRTYPALWVTCGEEDEHGEGRIGSNTIFQAIDAAPSLDESGLALDVSADGLSAAEPFVTVVLRNVGGESIAVPARLRSARRVLLRATPREGRSRALPLAFVEEEPYSPLGPDEIEVLEPGDVVTARLRLPSGWSAELPPGPYDLRALWANADAGDRPGLSTRPVVGRLVSDPIEIVVPAR